MSHHFWRATKTVVFKIGEEATEVIIAAKATVKNARLKKQLIFFHLLIVMAAVRHKS